MTTPFQRLLLGVNIALILSIVGGGFYLHHRLSTVVGDTTRQIERQIERQIADARQTLETMEQVALTRLNFATTQATQSIQQAEAGVRAVGEKAAQEAQEAGRRVTETARRATTQIEGLRQRLPSAGSLLDR